MIPIKDKREMRQLHLRLSLVNSATWERGSYHWLVHIMKLVYARYSGITIIRAHGKRAPRRRDQLHLGRRKMPIKPVLLDFRDIKIFEVQTKSPEHRVNTCVNSQSFRQLVRSVLSVQNEIQVFRC